MFYSLVHVGSSVAPRYWSVLLCSVALQMSDVSERKSPWSLGGPREMRDELQTQLKPRSGETEPRPTGSYSESL